MKKTIIFSILVIFLSCSENKTNYDFLSFEIRLTETEPNPNLTKMNLDNSDLIFFVQDSVFLNNMDIKSTEVIDWDTHPKVMVTLTDDGRDKFATYTQENIGKNAAILVNSKLVSAPKIMAGIMEGKLLIVGHFSHEEAVKIAEGILP
jgi:preprotein translocase subunit SecD